MPDLLAKLTAAKKTVTLVVGAAIAWGQLVVGSESTEITAPEWIAGAILLATAFGVYRVANEPAS